MANWNCPDAFKQQKKRNFIYKSSSQNKNPVTNGQKFERNLSNFKPVTNANVSAYSSPRKKMRSSYSVYDRSRSDKQAAEELCSGLTIDAFEDDGLDDFGDDSFTAEELCQVAEETELQVFSQSVKNVANHAVNLPKQSNNVLDKDNFRDCGNNLNVNERASIVDKSASYVPVSSMLKSNKMVETTETTAVPFYAESSPVNHSTTSKKFNNCKAKTSSTASNHLGEVDSNYKEKMQSLETQLKETQGRIKTLEEDNYQKDGNLKMLQDALDHLKSEEVQNKERLRQAEEQKKNEIKELQKNHAKSLEQLNSKICFQEQELKQAKEKRLNERKLNENSVGSPKRSKVNELASNSIIPTGKSFFEKSNSDSRSPQVKKVSRGHKSPEKDGKNADTKEEMTRLRLEKNSLSIKEDFIEAPHVELAQKIFKLPSNINDICMSYEATSSNQSLLSLMRLNLNVPAAELSKLEDNLNLQNVVLEKDSLHSMLLSSELDSEEVCLAIKGIQDLIDTDQLGFKRDETYLELVNNFKVSNIINCSQRIKSAINVLPLLEYHVLQYVQLRTVEEEGFMNTCPSSPSGDFSNTKDKDSLVVLSLALDGALQSLKCLGVLASCSSEVCEVLLKSVSAPLAEEDKSKTSATTQNVASTSNEERKVEKSDLLGLLFQLAIPQPNEPLLVSVVSLSVLESLVKNCPQQHTSWFFPRLCDALLPQCLSKEYDLNTLVVVTPILTKTLCHQHVCSQSDECVLLKIYQGCLANSLGLPHGRGISVHLKVVKLVNSIFSRNSSAIPYFIGCHCSLEFLKLLVCLMDKNMVLLEQYPAESLTSDSTTSLSLELLCYGILLLASLASCPGSNRLLGDLRILVGHKYNNLIIGCLRLFKDIPSLRNINEVLIDLLDENIEEHEVLEEEDGIEDMEIGD